jgi:hypothetical protein
MIKKEEKVRKLFLFIFIRKSVVVSYDLNIFTFLTDQQMFLFDLLLVQCFDWIGQSNLFVLVFGLDHIYIPYLHGLLTQR